MEIYLLRHAIAEDDSPSGLDADRPLSARGKTRMRFEALGMARLGLAFDRIVSSPLVRARQTAEIVAQSLGAMERLEEAEEIGARFSCDAVMRLLARFDPAHRVLLVGHQPDFSVLADFLLGGANVQFKKGALALIQTPGPPNRGLGILCWHLAPSHLRGLGGDS